MDDLISRERARHEFAYFFRNDYSVQSDCDSMLCMLPTIEAEPVRRGEWIKRDGYTECSACEYWYDSPDSEEPGDRSNFCPNCGAKMGDKHEID